MAIVYVSPHLASGNNDGTTAANAFKSIFDFAAAGCAAGSDVRQNADEICWGAANTRYDVTNPAGTTMRVTWDGTGTDPNFLTGGMAVGSRVTMGSVFNAANLGTWTVTAVTDDYFEVTNAAVVPENDKVGGALGLGNVAVTLTSNINGSVAAGFTTITGYDATWTTPTLRFRNGAGALANIDGFIMNGVLMVRFNYVGAKNYTRDGIRAVTTASKNIVFNQCQMSTNTAQGFNLGLTSPYILATMFFCKANNNATGISVQGPGDDRILCSEFTTNTTNVSVLNTGMIFYNCIMRNGTTGIVNTVYRAQFVNCIIDANTTGVSSTVTTNGISFIGCRFTNNATVAIAWGTAIVIETGLYNHFYNNGALHTGANGLYVANTDISDANNPYTDQPNQNFKNINTATLYKNLVNVGIDATNVTNIQAGLQRVLDYAALSKVMADDTNDGDTGTLALANVLTTAGGTFDEAARNISAGAGNIIIGAHEHIAGAQIDGTSANLTAADTVYLALEAGRNITAGAGNILNTAHEHIAGVQIDGTFDEAARNISAGAGNILVGSHEHIAGVQIDGTFDEAARNVSAGAGNIVVGAHEHIQGSQIDGTFDEAARNTPLAAKYQNGEHFLKLNVDTVGSYGGGGAGGGSPIIGSPIVKGL